MNDILKFLEPILLRENTYCQEPIDRSLYIH